MKTVLKKMMVITLSLLALWGIAVQSGCFSMRTSDHEWGAKLSKAGQPLRPTFLHVPAPALGRQIHAVALGHDSLPLVVLVHGSPGASDAFQTYLADTMLTSRVRLVAIDRPGFGYTEGFGRPEPSQKAQAAAVKAVIEALAPQQKVLLVGHSLGGAVIARFAMDYPETTAGLLFVASSIDPAMEEHPWWQRAVDARPVRWLTPKPLWTSNAEIIPLEQELNNMLPLWSKITCPAYLLHATDDRLVPVANVNFAKKMLVNSPDVRVRLLPKGDHFILWSRQDLVRQCLLELLAP
jgi:pimeloyl-ACP methyl ester carboxylesterase